MECSDIYDQISWYVWPLLYYRKEKSVSSFYLVTALLCTSSSCILLSSVSFLISPRLLSAVSVTSAEKDSCGLPPLMLMFCIPVSACQDTCAKELGHICMFSQCVLQLHSTDSNTKAFLWLTFRCGFTASCVALRIYGSVCGRAVGISLLCCRCHLFRLSTSKIIEGQDKRRELSVEFSVYLHAFCIISVLSCLSILYTGVLSGQTDFDLCLSHWSGFFVETASLWGDEMLPGGQKV